jgi:prepilin-type N-terminal cleavage/methylation domain-containing protein
MCFAEKKAIDTQGHRFAIGDKALKGFTLIELLVVISIISALMGILLPVFGKVRYQARMMLGMNNQRETTSGVSFFALDYDDRYPESVATIGTGSFWHWQEPTMITAYRKRSPMLNRSMSAYLSSYIENVNILFSPNAPRKYKYLEDVWDAGDSWDNPDTPATEDPVMGTYCFYWNYIGFLEGRSTLFRGPRGPSGGCRQSKLLVSDYFGYDHWRSPGAYGSSEKFDGAGVTPGTPISSAFWSRRKKAGVDLDTIKLKLTAGYTDGHVENYSASHVVPMKVSISADGTIPYPDGIGPGIFYLPKNGLR